MKQVYNIVDASINFSHEDPLEPGRYALPAGSTEIEPPEFDSSTHTCHYDGDQWIVTAIPEPDPEPEEEQYVPTYEDNRREEYGSAEKQLEYITENGLEAWQQKVAEIKAKYPKPTE
jgi:hypothetical protein